MSLSGKWPAIVRSIDRAGRQYRVEIPGLTDGAEVLPLAQKRLEAAKKRWPKAFLADMEDVSVIYLLADTKANVMSIGHDRLSNRTRLGEVLVTLELETRDHEHIINIQNQLLSNGYHIMLD